MIAATVVGNLGRDAEIKTVGNTSVLSFAVTGELSTRESAKTGKTYLEVRVDQLELLGGGSPDRGGRQDRSAARSGGDEEYARDDESFEDGLPF